MQARSYADLYTSAEERDRARRKQAAEARMLRGALESTATATSASESSGFQRMAMCRKGLEALDRRGKKLFDMHDPLVLLLALLSRHMMCLRDMHDPLTIILSHFVKQDGTEATTSATFTTTSSVRAQGFFGRCVFDVVTAFPCV